MVGVIKILASSVVEEGGQVAFSFPGSEGRPLEAFCVRHQGTPYAYLNICPHWGVALDMEDGGFWASKTTHLLCKNHGALFRPDDGFCESGPCFGASLMALPAEEREGQILVYGPKEEP